MAPLAAAALDLVFPSMCASCGVIGEVLCDRCAARLQHADGLRCPRCWLRAEGLCRACMDAPPAFRQLRSGFSYTGVARELILALKYGGVGRAAQPLVERSSTRAARPDIELVAPIPMTSWRRRVRGGNHAEHLARAIAAQIGAPVAPRLLERRGWRTKQQARSASLAERRANMRDAFRVREPVEGRTVLLVDDVSTTMATLDAAATALLAAGATAVDAWTATREELRD